MLTSSYSIKSFGQLKEAIWFATFDDALFELLLNEADRLVLQQSLLQTYFPTALISILHTGNGGLADDIIHQILQETAAVYRQTVAGADEEAIFICSGIFKKLVLSISTIPAASAVCVLLRHTISDD